MFFGGMVDTSTLAMDSVPDCCDSFNLLLEVPVLAGNDSFRLSAPVSCKLPLFIFQSILPVVFCPKIVIGRAMFLFQWKLSFETFRYNPRSVDTTDCLYQLVIDDVTPVPSFAPLIGRDKYSGGTSGNFSAIM